MMTMKINLFIGYFNHSNKQRKKEINECLEINCNHHLIDRVIVFDEEPEFKHYKIHYVGGGRPTYQDFFNNMKEYPNDINIIANSDIYFDNTLIEAKRIGDKTCYALTRTEKRGIELVEFRNYHQMNKGCPESASQDVWIFKGSPNLNNYDKVVAQVINNNKHEIIPFELGHPGVDNVFSAKLKSNGYTMKNPFRIIRAIHNHKDTSRPNYKYRMTGTHSKWGIIRNGFINNYSL